MSRDADILALRPLLDGVEANLDRAARVASDPIRFPRRYSDPVDREIAGFVASTFAYGRVTLFLPVLEALFAVLDARGGPAAFTRSFDPRAPDPFVGLYYRFYGGSDLVLLFAALRILLERRGALEPGPGPVAQALDGFVAELRAAAVEAAARWDLPSASPPGFRYMASAPSDGSASKRLNLWVRWMVRSDAVDLGVWTRLRPRDLVIPLDTHVARISRFLGLTARKDTSWRTAAEVTAALAVLDPDDPVRYDFALAHLGISGSCLGYRAPHVCGACPLDPACRAG